jgi:hypothetical protein
MARKLLKERVRELYHANQARFAGVPPTPEFSFLKIKEQILRL